MLFERASAAIIPGQQMKASTRMPPLGRVTFAAAKDHRREAGLRRVFREMPVVAHQDDNDVVGHAKLVHLVEQVSEPNVELQLLVDMEPAIGAFGACASGARVVQRDHRPVLQEKRIRTFGEPLQFFERLVLKCLVHLVIFGGVLTLARCHADLADRPAGLALDHRR